MGFYRQEATRLSSEFRKLAEKNPFADFTVVKRFDQAAGNWQENTRTMEEANPMTVSVRAHQALGQVNLAIERLLASLNQSQSQSMSSSGSSSLENYFRNLKKMLQEQKKLNQDSQSLKQMMEEGNKNQRIPGQGGESQKEGEPKPGDQQAGDQQQSGEQGKNGQQGDQGTTDQLRKLAEQQRNIRRQLEELENRYKETKGRTGSLEGVGELMKDVEKEMEQQRLNDRVTDKQLQIEQRLLDAERSMHQKGFKKKRKALHAEGEAPEAVIEEPALAPEEVEAESLARLLRQNLEEVSPQWRERIRTYYDNLLKMGL
jgi:hypothetical protein